MQKPPPPSTRMGAPSMVSTSLLCVPLGHPPHLDAISGRNVCLCRTLGRHGQTHLMPTFPSTQHSARPVQSILLTYQMYYCANYGCRIWKATVPCHSFNGLPVPVTTCTLSAKDPQEAEGPTKELHPSPSSLVCCFFKPQVSLGEVGLCGPNETQINGHQEPPSQELSILFGISSPLAHAIEAARTTPFGSLRHTG